MIPLNSRPRPQTDFVAAYETRFARGDLRESQGFYRWLLGHLPISPRATVLDIACGNGTALEVASRLGYVAFGLDFSKTALASARERMPLCRVVHADGEALPFCEAAFDIVTLIGSLEHFLAPGRGLTEARRLVKPVGCLAIFVPNSYYLVDIIWQVWRKGRPPSHHQLVERFATISEWHEFFENHGLSVQNVWSYNFLFPQTREDWLWYRDFPRKFWNLLVSPFIPFNLSYSFLYLCVPK